MDPILIWTLIIVGLSFALYIGIAIWARAGSTSDFYVAGGAVPPLANGMATAADWMSAASFISMAGLISFMGRDGSVYLMGWTGGYVLLALLLAPYLRKFGKFTVPDFVGDRYYSSTARVVAVACAVFVSFVYVAGQMRGTGIVFSRFLNVDVEVGVVVGMVIVFFYAVFGGMKGITYTQVAQYCVLIFAYLVPAIFLSLLMTGQIIPQVGFGSELLAHPGVTVLERLDGIGTQLGFDEYTSGVKGKLDVFFITFSLMVGTAGLPHVIVRFFTVPKVKDARKSALYALIFIVLLYATAPAIAAFARVNLFDTVSNVEYEEVPNWFKNWEETGLVAWMDKNDDGVMQYYAGAPFQGAPDLTDERGEYGQRMVTNTPTDNRNEVYVDRDIIVLANPEIGDLPAWVVGLIAAGGVAAALSTAAGLLLVISTSVAHDLVKRTLRPDMSDKKELMVARVAAGVAVFIAGYFGIYPPGFVAQTVAFAFGLAAASFFPTIMLGIFYKRMNKEGAIAGMIAGITVTTAYIIFFTFIRTDLNNADFWLFGISPQGFGTVGMLVNFAAAMIVSSFTAPPPENIQRLVENIRIPRELKDGE